MADGVVVFVFNNYRRARVPRVSLALSCFLLALSCLLLALWLFLLAASPVCSAGCLEAFDFLPKAQVD